ncbi:MAG: hypothetical protein Q9206_001611 [Seirophora lacunosa]
MKGSRSTVDVQERRVESLDRSQDVLEATMALEPIVLYSAPYGPNPYKVAIVLTELSLPFETVVIWDAAELKKAPFTDINPNGRAPAIKDPSTGIFLWESCAIIRYLIDQYDKTNALSYDTTPEKYLLDQWFFFQASGQGPYYGQAGWFNMFHPEKLPSAQDRYIDQTKRVVGVLDAALGQSKSGWLVGDRCTYVDLSFFMWDEQIEPIMAAVPSSEWRGDDFRKPPSQHRSNHGRNYLLRFLFVHC